MLAYALSFIAVAKAGGYTKAAKLTGISKAKLSRHVKELERELNIQLLYRTTKSFALTEAGHQFFASCEDLEEVYNSAVEKLKQDTATLKGTLKITAPIDFGIKFLGPVIAEFAKTYPLMDVRLSLSNEFELIGKHYDLAIRIVNQLPDSNLRMIKLMEFTRVVCASPSYLKKHTKPKSPAELKNHLCTSIVNQNQDTVKPSWAFTQNKKLVNYSLDHVIECDSYALQKQFVEAGLCISRLPSYYVDKELKSGKLIELFPEYKKPITSVYCLYPNVAVVPQKTRAFIDILKKSLGAIASETCDHKK